MDSIEGNSVHSGEGIVAQPPLVRYEKYEITEYRDGAVFKTKKVGHIWHPLGQGMPVEPGFVFASTGETHYSTIPHPLYPN